jgi:alcohol dehydrogenase, propanol-preferring
MRAMVLQAPGSLLQMRERADPEPGEGEVRVKVSACGVCRTDLHVVDAELPNIRYPIVPGHEIVGRVDRVGPNVTMHRIGDRVGVPWLGYTCGVCRYCREGMENLCDRPLFTGYTRDGGYATHTIADARYAFPLGEDSDDVSVAPLLCAGLIGWRSLVMAGDAKRLGIYGFGAAGHIVAQVARWQGRAVYAFTRSEDTAAQNLARRLGAVWAGGSEQLPDQPLDAAIIYAAAGPLVPAAPRGAQGRPRGMRGHPYERHSELSLSPALGGAPIGVGRQPHAPGRPGFFEDRAAGRHPHGDHGVPARRGQRGADTAAERTDSRCRRPHTLGKA